MDRFFYTFSILFLFSIFTQKLFILFSLPTFNLNALRITKSWWMILIDALAFTCLQWMYCADSATCFPANVIYSPLQDCVPTVDWLFRANWQFQPIVRNSCIRARPPNECRYYCCVLLQKCTSDTSIRLIRQFRNPMEIVIQELACAWNFAKT